MAKVHYSGLQNPRADFEALTPFRDQLLEMKNQYFPFKEDYLALHAVTQALDAACLHFTGDERFYWVGDTGCIGGAK